MNKILLLISVLVTGCMSDPKTTDPREYATTANRNILTPTVVKGPVNSQERNLFDKIDLLFSSSSGYRSYKENIGKLVSLPKLLHVENPVYPPGALVQRVQANLTLAALIDTDGKVKDVKVLSTSDARFNNAAIESVSKWKFSGGTTEGEPDLFVMVIPIKFLLSE